MSNKAKAYLRDIVQSIEEIFDFIGPERNFLRYQRDQRTKKAVERNLEIIGEAVNRLAKESPEISITNARLIVGTRNRIIHSYDHISDEIIWTIVCRELPILKREVDTLLSSLD